MSRTDLEALMNEHDDDVRLLTRNHPKIERTETAQLDRTASTDPFEDDTPLACGIDNPDYCESCQ